MNGTYGEQTAGATVAEFAVIWFLYSQFSNWKLVYLKVNASHFFFPNFTEYKNTFSNWCQSRSWGRTYSSSKIQRDLPPDVRKPNDLLSAFPYALFVVFRWIVIRQHQISSACFSVINLWLRFAKCVQWMRQFRHNCMEMLRTLFSRLWVEFSCVKTLSHEWYTDPNHRKCWKVLWLS